MCWSWPWKLLELTWRCLVVVVVVAEPSLVELIGWRIVSVDGVDIQGIRDALLDVMRECPKGEAVSQPRSLSPVTVAACSCL